MMQEEKLGLQMRVSEHSRRVLCDTMLMHIMIARRLFALEIVYSDTLCNNMEAFFSGNHLSARDVTHRSASMQRCIMDHDKAQKHIRGENNKK